MTLKPALLLLLACCHAARAAEATWRGRPVVLRAGLGGVDPALKPHLSWPFEYATHGVALTMAGLLVLCAVAHWACIAVSSLRSAAAGDKEPLLVNGAPSSQRGGGAAPASRARWLTVLSGYVDARASGLSSVRLALVAATYVAVSVGWAAYWVAVWPNGQDLPTKDRVARVLGQLNVVNMLVAVVPATRYGALWLLVGAPFDRALPLHRWAGIWTALVLCAHLVACFVALGKGVVWYNGAIDRYAMYGLSAFVCCVWLSVTSLPPVRRARFNLFRASHLAFVPFFVFAVLHEKPVMLPYAVAAACVYGADRLLRLASAAVPRDAVVAKLADGVMRVRWPRPAWPRQREAGQYVFLCFPGVGCAGALEWHPFTLCSAPQASHFEVNVRALGDYTARLGAELRDGARVSVRHEGPYGRLAVEIGGYASLALVCNGIGITPMVAVLREVYGLDAPGDAGAEAGAAARAPRAFGAVRSVALHWGVRTRSQYSWFSDVVERCRAAAAQSAGALPELRVSVYVDGEPAPAPGQEQWPAPFAAGRADLSRIVRDAEEAQPAAVLACGVQPVVEALWDRCAASRRAGAQVDFHFESFLF